MEAESSLQPIAVSLMLDSTQLQLILGQKMREAYLKSLEQGSWLWISETKLNDKAYVNYSRPMGEKITDVHLMYVFLSLRQWVFKHFYLPEHVLPSKWMKISGGS